MTTSFKVMALTRFGMEPHIHCPEADALSTPHMQSIVAIFFQFLIIYYYQPSSRIMTGAKKETQNGKCTVKSVEIEMNILLAQRDFTW